MRKLEKFKRVSARMIVLTLIMSVMMSVAGICTAFAANEVDDANGGMDKTDEFEEQLPEGTTFDDNFITEYGLTGKELKDGAKYTGEYVEINGKYYKYGVASSAVTNANIGEIDHNVKANVSDANELVSGFEPVINLVIGILAWLIVILLPLVTALDVCYITIPFVREKGEDARASGNKMMTKTGKDGQTKLRWISDEAQYAVSDIDLESGSSPLKKYLMKRIGAFVMVAIILYLLIGGQITVVTQLAVRLVSGIMSILSSLGK